MDSPYEIILQLPLFQGLTLMDINQILSKVKLSFEKFEQGKTIVSKGTQGKKLLFVLSGTVCKETTSDKGNKRSPRAMSCYRLREYIDEPFVIEPYSLFGLDNYYQSTYTARTSVGVMTVSKSDLLSHLCHYPIFFTNYTNILSRRAQLYNALLWREARKEADTEKAIREFLLQRFSTLNGRKEIRINKRQLSAVTAQACKDITKALADMTAKGIIEVNGNNIYIADAHML